MNSLPSSEHDEQDGAILKLLKALWSRETAYPAGLLVARRAAYLAQVERLTTEAADEELSPADQEIVTLLGIAARSTQVDYPVDLMPDRQSAFVRHVETVEHISLADQFRLFIQRIFPSETKNPALSPAGFMRLSLVVASLIAALFLGSLFTRNRTILPASPLQAAATPTAVLPARTSEAALTSCQPDAQSSSCLPETWEPGQDLADPGNGVARPAVSKDTYPVHMASYVNDGRADASWVSRSADSWIKIDLGQVRTINMVSLEKGQPVASQHDDPGGFVIAVALSDVYAEGDSEGDDQEYAQVFHSEGGGAGNTIADAELISTHFSPVEARFVKITFEREGAAIEEVRVFMAEEPVLAEQPTRTPRTVRPGSTLTPPPTNTLLATATATSVPGGTSVPTATPTHGPTTTAAPSQTATNTPDPSDTPTVLPTYPQTATDTPDPSDNPVVLPTDTPPPADISTPAPTPLTMSSLVPPTAIDPATIPPTVQAASVRTEPIAVTGSDQTMAFTCKGNAVEIRGHANTVTLLGSCSSITVAGNGNHIFWQFGSPVITIKGEDNIVRQL